MQCSPWCRKKKKNLQVHSLLLYMDLKLFHITHDSQLWAGCRRELALCCVLVWLVNVKMWYWSFSKHSWLEKSGHSGGKVNKISPSVPESWCECEWQPAAVRARRQRWLSKTAKLVEFPFVRNSFHPYRRHFSPATVTQNQQKEPQTWQTTKSRSVSCRQGAHSRPRIYYMLLSRMNKSVFISSV